jgi:hypothetical protein
MTGLSLLNKKETADYLRISVRTLDNITQPRGTLPCIRIGRSIRYSVTAIEYWLKQQESTSEMQQ